MQDFTSRGSFDEDEQLELRFDEYAYHEFQRVRWLSQLKNEDVVRSFDPEKNHRIFKTQINEKGAGKSGKQILMTHDKRYIVKEIDKEEKD